jgi:hypothetical protein
MYINESRLSAECLLIKDVNTHRILRGWIGGVSDGFLRKRK